MSTEVKKSALIIEGCIFMLLGVLAIALPTATSVSVAMIVGILLIIAGVIQVFRVFEHREGAEFWIPLILALLAILVGVLMLVYPLHGILVLAMLLGIWFFFHGIIEIAMAIQFRKVSSGWGFLLFSGIVSILLALLIWSGWPTSAVWLIGLLLGINLLLFGASLIMLALTKHS